MRLYIVSAFLVALAPAVSHAGKFVEFERVTSGHLVYYGHFLRPPYILGSDGTQMILRCPADTAFAAAGIVEAPWVLHPPRPPLLSLSTADSLRFAAMEEHSTRVRAISRAAYESGLRDWAWMERKAKAYRSSDVVDSARVLDPNTILVHWKGWYPERATEYEPPTVPVTLESSLRKHAAEVARDLRTGRLTVVDYGTEWITPPHATQAALAELKSLRTGGRPHQLRNPDLIKRFRNPPPSLRTLVGSK